MQQKQQKDPMNINNKLSAYMQYQRSGYFQQEIYSVEITLFDKTIYVLLTMHRHVIYWYHLYINQHGGGRIENNTGKLCHWKVLVTQV